MAAKTKAERTLILEKDEFLFWISATLYTDDSDH
jgi:hypothetical protein